jgi:transcriptional regulator with XRE-family HTH domain
MRNNLIERRKAQGLTQGELGKLVGVSVAFICALETSFRKGPVEIWDRLEDVLKAPQRWLREEDAPWKRKYPVKRRSDGKPCGDASCPPPSLSEEINDS